MAGLGLSWWKSIDDCVHNYSNTVVLPKVTKVTPSKLEPEQPDIITDLLTIGIEEEEQKDQEEEEEEEEEGGDGIEDMDVDLGGSSCGDNSVLGGVESNSGDSGKIIREKKVKITQKLKSAKSACMISQRLKTLVFPLNMALYVKKSVDMMIRAACMIINELKIKNNLSLSSVSVSTPTTISEQSKSPTTVSDDGNLSSFPIAYKYEQEIFILGLHECPLGR